MVLINYATKEIVAKVVYYGPALCGKTTNLQVVYTKLNPKKRGKMISLATESDRTLFFDFLPMELGTVQGFKVRFQLYTVPGQVRYGATRKLVLKGADAVVFVADSQEALLDANKDSIEDMKSNLIENGLNPDVIPLVIQYNKRDLNGVMEVEDLERELNWRGTSYFEAEAVNGPGVMETLLEITRLLIADMKTKHSNINTDKIKDLKMDAFLPEQEKELEAEEVVFEIERGFGNFDDEEDVVAGELLDQIETISVDTASQAEQFFDNVRKGTSAEEAKERAIAVNPIDDDGMILDLDKEVEIVGGPELERAHIPMDEREISFAELDPVIEPSAPEPPVLEIEPEPEPPPSKPKPKPKLKHAPPPKPKVSPSPPPPPPSFEPDEPFEEEMGGGMDIFATETAVPPPPSLGMVSEVDLSGIEAKLDEIRGAVTRLEKEVGVLGRAATAASVPGGPAPDLSGGGELVLPPALEILMSKLGESIERIEQEVSGMRLGMTLAREQGGGAGAGISPEDMALAMDGLKNKFMGAMEGQDKLLLKVLETIRESKQAVLDGHERQDDALKYIIDKVRDEDDKTSKKKWY
jgi:hypothetical protein